MSKQKTLRCYLFVGIYKSRHSINFYPSLQYQGDTQCLTILRDLNQGYSITIHQVFINNGKEFTDRLLICKNVSHCKRGI